MYIVIEIQTNADGTVGNLVWSYATLAEAESKYHSVLAAAAVSALPVHGATILRNDCQQFAGQAYRHGEETETAE